MYLEYNFDEMCATSERLNSILNEGNISVESIRRFANCGLALKWEGVAAERFRADLHRMTFVQNFDGSVMLELRFIANYPRKCAEQMAAADQKIAAKIRAILNG